MLCLIPAVKQLTLLEGHLEAASVCPISREWDSRIVRAAQKLPCSETGAALTVSLTGESGEGYTLDIGRSSITVTAEGPAGAFYAMQTLRQIFRQGSVPCLHIEDRPDFAYRGFYHDITRGKIPTVETLKTLIDQMARYKLNALQLYVEHTFAFKEYAGVHERTGCLTPEDLAQLGAYCKENFIDFQPSLSTFGHLFELMEQPQYRHLRVDNRPARPNFWSDRMRHHTIDPLNPESIQLIQSLIDQYIPCFDSACFNICCDETFDLQLLAQQGIDPGAVYAQFSQKIIRHVQSKDKKVMMWADIALKHPEIIHQLPDDICYLNWQYEANPSEEKIRQLSQAGKQQILCPGTTTWNRLCENVDRAQSNICAMAEYAHRYGAEGILNTNWGDWGNPCCLELSMYGMVLGAEKSWSVHTPADEQFYRCVDTLLYEQDGAFSALQKLSRMHNMVSWLDLCKVYFHRRYGQAYKALLLTVDVAAVQKVYCDFVQELSAQQWKNDEYRQEMLIAAQGICVIAELMAKLEGKGAPRLTHTGAFLEKYREKWLQKNLPFELSNIEELFNWCESC